MNKSLWFRITLSIVIILGMLSLVQPVWAQVSPSATDAATDTAVPPTNTPEAPNFSIALDSTAKSGIPGSVISYTLSINYLSGFAPVDFAISAASVSGWTPGPTAEQTKVNLAPGSSTTITIDVPIPSAATAGQNDIQTISVQSSIGTKSINMVTTVNAIPVAGKPLMSVSSYYVSSGKIAAGNNFDLAVVLQNNGTARAYNVVITFDGGTGFYPQGTGGVRSTSGIDAGGTFTATQTFLGAGELAWTGVEVLKASVTYSDAGGTSYTDAFTLSLGVIPASGSGIRATPTPVPNNHAQLVVTSYKTDVDLLQPGTSFDLSIDVKNLGSSDATGVTMVLGGGATSANDTGTPQASGGVSGSSGELTNFAPLNSSNLTYIGNLKIGESKTLSQKLIVNTSTAPGVYTLKISFVYSNSKGTQVVDDQVITLLVYSLPQVQVDFYRDLGVITAQMDNVLPIQVTNLGKKTTVLGTMKVTANGATLTNNVSLVGSLDPGGYFTLDTGLFPDQAGSMDINITINYTDDFNQPRTVEQKITIDVQPAMEPTPDTINGSSNGGVDNGSTVPPQSETFWQKVGRFFKGLFGLDSGSNDSGGKETPTEIPPVNIYPSNGGKG
jgi:hypothetical protein